MRASALVPCRYWQLWFGGLEFFRPDHLALAVLNLDHKPANPDLHVSLGIDLMPAHDAPDLERSQDLANLFGFDRTGLLHRGFEHGARDETERRVISRIRVVLLAIGLHKIGVAFAGQGRLVERHAERVVCVLAGSRDEVLLR